MIKVEPVTLQGSHVRLEPLTQNHHAALCEIGLDPEVWKWIPNRCTTPEEMKAYIQLALDWQSAGTAVPFATLLNGRVVGCTRFMNIDVVNRHVEIGATWIGRDWQRSVVNTEAKYLMLRHAFEVWKCLRVELKTDVLNHKSRNAIRRLGARQEGIFRNHVLTWSGRMRHSVWFSILDTEWPVVKTNLEEKLKNPATKPFQQIEALSEPQIEDLLRLMNDPALTLEAARRMLDASDLIVAFADSSGRLVAFSRILTDYVSKALVLDLKCDPGFRATLMNSIRTHPDLADVRSLEERQ